jgi:hypothetical protein
MATNAGIGLAYWRDTRAKAKGKAAAELETIKRQALWRAAHLSAAAARATGSLMLFIVFSRSVVLFR